MPVVRRLILFPFQVLLMYIVHNSFFSLIAPWAIGKANKSTRIALKIKLLLLMYCLIFFLSDYSKHQCHKTNSSGSLGESVSFLSFLDQQFSSAESSIKINMEYGWKPPVKYLRL